MRRITATAAALATHALTGCAGHEWMSASSPNNTNGSLADTDGIGGALFTRNQDIQVARAKEREDAARAAAIANASTPETMP